MVVSPAPPADGNPILQTRGLVSGYGRVETLHGIDVDVPARGITTIVGPNGSGKSTLLKSVVGLLRPWEGDVLFDGRQVGGKAVHKLVREGLCLVPQGRVVFPNLTVEENLRISGFTLRDERVLNERLEAAFEFFPSLVQRRRYLANNLSGGEQTMLALGKAIMLSPRLLLLDEPSLGLSPKNMDMVFAHVVSLAERGMPILIVEQNVRKGLSVADHAIVLVLGVVRFEGRPDELESKVDLARLFLELDEEGVS